MDLNSPPREGKRDPPGSDPELERASASSELDEEVDDWIDDRSLEDRRIVVVPGGNALAEVPIVVHRRNLPWEPPSSETRKGR